MRTNFVLQYHIDLEDGKHCAVCQEEEDNGTVSILQGWNSRLRLITSFVQVFCERFFGRIIYSVI